MRAARETLPVPAADLQDVNRRLIAWAARVDRHHLKGLAANDNLIVRLRRKAQVRRRDPRLPVALLDQPRDLARDTAAPPP
jgi:hypothetical protein